MSREKLAAILEEIACDQELDESKLAEFETLLAHFRGDALIGAAADELTEYALTWAPIKNILGVTVREKPDAADTLEHRSNLRLYAKAIRQNLSGRLSPKQIQTKIKP